MQNLTIQTEERDFIEELPIHNTPDDNEVLKKKKEQIKKETDQKSSYRSTHKIGFFQDKI